MEWIAITFIFTLFLAYANGANDNFKGVATLYGSKTASYKTALIWTSVATVLGALTALYVAHDLIIVFKGNGLVPKSIIDLPIFPVAVGLGAATTVMLATHFGLPVSTTHALIGSLAGAGWMASSTGINSSMLAQKFFLPLIAGPLLSVVLAVALYPLFKTIRKKIGFKPETCLCIGKKVIARVPITVSTSMEALSHVQTELAYPKALIADEGYCKKSYTGEFFGISAGSILDALHFASGGIVSFARGLNDTPKIAALLLIGSAFNLEFSIFSVGIAMLVGGLIHSRKIAITMGDKITDMNPGQAFTANLITGIMVIGASKIGVPVSTTHVSCGSIFGIGAITKQAHWKVIGNILLAWVTTLPLGAILGGLTMFFLLKI